MAKSKFRRFHWIIAREQVQQRLVEAKRKWSFPLIHSQVLNNPCCHAVVYYKLMSPKGLLYARLGFWYICSCRNIWNWYMACCLFRQKFCLAAARSLSVEKGNVCAIILIYNCSIFQTLFLLAPGVSQRYCLFKKMR